MSMDPINECIGGVHSLDIPSNAKPLRLSRGELILIFDFCPYIKIKTMEHMDH